MGEEGKMTNHKTLKRDLFKKGFKFRFLGKSGIKELATLLEKNEVVHHCIYGYYAGGSAVLAATNNRLLLIDKRVMFSNMEDMRYQSIRKTRFYKGMLGATLVIKTKSNRVMFRSYSDAKLSELSEFIKQLTLVEKSNEDSLTDKLKLIEFEPAGRGKLLPRRKIGKMVYNIVSATE